MQQQHCNCVHTKWMLSYAREHIFSPFSPWPCLLVSALSLLSFISHSPLLESMSLNFELRLNGTLILHVADSVDYHGFISFMKKVSVHMHACTHIHPHPHTHTSHTHTHSGWEVNRPYRNIPRLYALKSPPPPVCVCMSVCCECILMWTYILHPPTAGTASTSKREGRQVSKCSPTSPWCWSGQIEVINNNWRPTRWELQPHLASNYSVPVS